MQDTEGLDSLADQIDGLVAALRRGMVSACELEGSLLDLLDTALDGDLDPEDETVFVDHLLAITIELSDDPRVGRATMHDTVRSHLDRLVERPAASARLDDHLAAIRIGLTFDCDAQHLELIELCREGRAIDPVLYADGGRALEVVGLAGEFEVVRALEATVEAGEDPWKRLGQHHDAWTAAFDALAAVAWSPGNPRRGLARESLLELLGQPHAALEAAVRIRPAWLAEAENIHRALTALDRLDEWIAAQPHTCPTQDSRFAAIRHAVTSLVWLAQDAERSWEVHLLWGGAGVSR